MKKLILILTVILTASLANAQGKDVKTSEVPDLVTSKFSSLYPGTKAEQWKSSNGNYETKFSNSGSKMCVVINPSGSVVETSTVIKATELPKPAADYVAKNYAKQKIKESCKTTEAGGKVKYEAVVNDYRLCFDSEGAFVKSEKCKK